MSSTVVKRSLSDSSIDDDDVVAASFKRLCDAKRTGHAGSQKIKELSEAIWALEKAREEAVQEGARFIKGTLTESCHAYSRAWNRSFAAKLLTIPRELRDMIYAQIWTNEFLSTTCPAMVGRLQGVEVAPLPHVVDTLFVGPDVAREMVEAYYRIAPLQVHAFHALEPDDIERLVCDDVFGVGIDPAHCLRQMNITLDVDALTLPPRAQVDVEQINEPLTALLEIVKKKDFKLTIELAQRRIRLGLWEAYFKMLKPILEAFESAGAKVEIEWAYRSAESWHPPSVKRRLNDLIRDTLPGWKEDMVQELSDTVGIDPFHMEFLFEDNDNYDPANFESEYEDDDHTDDYFDDDDEEDVELDLLDLL